MCTLHFHSVVYRITAVLSMSSLVLLDPVQQVRIWAVSPILCQDITISAGAVETANIVVTVVGTSA